MHGLLGYMEENHIKVVGTLGRLLGKSRGYNVHGIAGTSADMLDFTGSLRGPEGSR